VSKNFCPLTQKPCDTRCRLWLGDGCSFELIALYMYDIGRKMNKNENEPTALVAMGLE